MPAERVLIDTNVLVYATDTASPHCPASSALLGAVASGSFLACVAPQVLLEFVSVVSSPKRVASARAADEAWGVADSFAQSFEVLTPPADLYQRASVLGRRLGLKMQDVFDLAIAITALESGVGIIYSYDSAVFSRVPGITVRVPTVPTP
jgi:predicted nucleic acid-binding protein